MGGGEASYQAYRREICGQVMPQSLRTLVQVLLFLNTIYIPFDYWAYPELFGFLLATRMGLNLTLLFGYAFRERWPLPMGIVCLLATGAMLDAMIAASGGVTSDYSTSLLLLFCGIPVLVPLSAVQTCAVVGVVFAVYAVLPLFPGLETSWRDYVANASFPLSGAVVAVGSAQLLDRIRFTDFQRRREIERARDELKALDREKSRFTANVHHELRTPLTLMLAPLDAMLGGEFGPVSGLQRGYLTTMHTNARRLLKLINNLLDLAKIEGEQLRVRRVPLSVAEPLAALVEGARPLAERKGVALEVGLEALPRIHADPEALEKIFVNLIGNALKFTDRGGRIELSGHGLDDGGVELRVTDTGAGIPADQLERVFDRFAQVDSSGTRRHEGTGIGLSLVKELVELHGGQVRAESEGPGHGTSMVVVLPAGEPDADPDEEVLTNSVGGVVSLGNSIAAIEGELDLEAAPEDALVEMERTVERADAAGPAAADVAESRPLADDAPEVLIVEDNADMRRLLAHLVGQEFWVRVARNGREGLDEVRASPPELVLTDVMMPEMSGTELCRALKEDPATREIPVVLVTSKAEREMKVHGLELGADDYVTKPFHPRELMARVRSLVRLRRLQEDLSERNARLESTNAELEAVLAELKDAQLQLVQAERLAAVGELAAGVAHEVNNPVNFATNALRTLETYVGEVRAAAESLGSLDLSDPARREEQVVEIEKLRDALELDEVVGSLGELVGIVTEGLDRTQRLVGDLRDFAAPGDGPRAQVDLRRGIQSTLQLVGHEMRRCGVETHLDAAPGLPQVRGDARALNQVFLNLFKNAAEALEGRGGSVNVSLRHEGDDVVVDVQDDGPGIDSDVQSRLFEPFFSTKGPGRGTGLGLSISRRIVTEHGGSIEVASAPGEGARFRVRLPALEDGVAT